MAKLTAILLLLIPIQILAQVKIDVKLEQTQHLAGEPVVVLVNVENIGATAVDRASCFGRAWMDVEGVARKIHPNIMGCYTGTGSRDEMRGCFGVFPQLKPGERTTFRYSLEGYRLPPGEYKMHVTGTAGVRKPGSTVEGQGFDAKFSFIVVPSDEASLRRAFARYVEPPISEESRDAIISAAPAFLEKTIASFKTREAAWALGEINSPESRQDLRDMFAGATDAGLRSNILGTLAQTGATDNVPFFADLLASGSVDAAYGLALAHSDAAVETLKNAYATADRPVRSVLTRALGNTQSRTAVAALIALPQTLQESYAACGALAVLTHLDWCKQASSPGNNLYDTKVSWQRWWSANSKKVTIYGTDQCLDLNAFFPPIR